MAKSPATPDEATEAQAAQPQAQPADVEVAPAPAEVVAGDDDPRVKAAQAATEQQARDAATAKAVINARIGEPTNGPPPEVMDVLGDTARPSGHLRLASVSGSGQRLQAEWLAGDKAAWFDVPSVWVDSLPEPAPATTADAWPGVPGSRRPSREA